MNAQLANWSDSLMASLSAALSLLFAAVPRVLGFLVILAIGWFVAAVIEKVLVAVLRALRVDGFTERAGLGGMVRTLKREPSAVLGTIAKWFVRLIALVAAFDALGVPAVAAVFNQLLLWLPNLAVALAVLGIGGVAANWFGDVVRSAAVRAGLEHEALAAAARWAVWAFAVLVAVNQVGIASTLVDILFMAVAGAAALALGLAFGLGGRDTAGIVVRNLYERSRHRAGALGRTVGSANAPPASLATAAEYQGVDDRGMDDHGVDERGVDERGVEHRQAVTDRRNGPSSRQPG